MIKYLMKSIISLCLVLLVGCGNSSNIPTPSSTFTPIPTVLACTLPTQSPVITPTPSPTATPIEKTFYVIELVGLTLEIPSTYGVYFEDELSSLDLKYEIMLILNNGGNYITLSIREANDFNGSTMSEICDSISQYYADAFYSNGYEELGRTERIIAGETYYGILSTLGVGGTFMDIYINRIDEHISIFRVEHYTENNKKSIYEVLDSAKSIDK